MLIKKLFFIALILLIGACDGAENASEQNNVGNDGSIQPIRFDEKNVDIYDSPGPSIGEMGGYEQSEQRGVNTADFSKYSDVFTNEESIRISEELAKQKDIIQAQVASTEDRIIVAVMLREHFDHHVAHKIEDEVRKIVPDSDKQIIVYTDDIQWDRMKNIDARLGARETGYELGNILEEFFQIND
ncbi:YhcN/YlaJ family sporulation lipoprotein [Oceanobacillus saliphilus]|uniref:YhcN/YlaJ family sporulation lipoprotein n=1 Tax=Oceanobacillus saliphilus TaxID=2925834 RepID=UPI00201D2F65|nr:YhcN/YlaJ family sporulation lipoprotein [Oceanobacillus saliphilus]